MKGFDRLSHAYITNGQAVDDLAMAALCSISDASAKPCGRCNDCRKAKMHIHPDIITIDRLKDKRTITVDQIRWLKTDVCIMPNEAAKKVYIVNDAETMNREAQNAFLQMLEDPPSHAVFILKTSNPAALLETIRSRCVKSGSQPASAEHPESIGVQPAGTSEAAQLAADFIAALSDNLLLTKFMFRLDKTEKPTFTDFIPLAREQLAKALRKEQTLHSHTGLSREKAILADDLLTKAAEMLDLNVNTGHISGMLCASLMSE